MLIQTSSIRALGLTFALAATAASVQAQTERRTLSGRDITIYDLVGSVTVEHGTGSDVVVEITRRGADARRLEIDVVSEGNGQSLRVIFPDEDIVYPMLGRRYNADFQIGRDGRWGGFRDSRFSNRRVRVRGDGRGIEAWADLRVTIPSGKRVDINVGVGEVNASGVNGDLGIDVASARVTVAGHTGTLRLDTGSGGADVRDVKGDELSVDVGSGRVSVFGADVRRMVVESGSGGVTVDRVNAAELSVDVGSGGVRIDRATSDRVRVETGSGGVSLELSNSPSTLDVESGSGTVNLSLPANLDAEIDVETGSGGIDSDFPVSVNRMSRNRLRGVVGRGTGHIRVETGSGSVRLRKL